MKLGHETVEDLSSQTNKEGSLCSSPSNSSSEMFGSSPLHLKSFSATSKLEELSEKHSSKQPSFGSVLPASVLPAKVEVNVGSVKDADMKEGGTSPPEGLFLAITLCCKQLKPYLLIYYNL